MEQQFTTTIRSARSQRQLAIITLDCVSADIAVQQQLRFSVVKGLGNLWHIQQNGARMTIANSDGQEFFIVLTALPTERAGYGYLTVDSILPDPDAITPKPVLRRKRTKRRRRRPLLQRIRDKLFGR